MLEEDNETLIADLTEIGQRVVIAKGRQWRLATRHFKSSTNRAPRRANPGEQGEEMTIWLRLKLIADAGLSACRTPASRRSWRRSRRQAEDRRLSVHDAASRLGVVGIDGREFVMADIPGLIEGARR